MTDSSTAIGSVTPVFGVGAVAADGGSGPIQTLSVSAPLTSTGGPDPMLGITNFTAVARGTVPASGGSATQFLRADVTWGDVPLFPGVYVYAESDLPAAVAGKITLAASTVYWIMGVVTLTAGNYIERPTTTAIIGTTASTCKIIGDINAPLLTESGAAATGRLDSVTFQNNNAGALACAIVQSVASSTLIMINVLGTAASCAFRSTVAANVTAQLSAFTATSGTEAIDLAGGGSFGWYQCSSVAVAAGAAHVRLRAGAAFTTLTFTAHGCIAYGANQFGIVDEGATISDRARINVTAQGPAVGTFTVNLGWTQGTPGWSIVDTYGLPDSAAIGAIDLTTPLTVVVSAALTYYDVSDGGVTWTFDTDSERFVARAGTGTQNGELEFTGTAPRRGIISGSVAVRRAAGSAAIGCRVSTYVDGVLHPSSVASSDITNRLVQIALAPSIHVFTGATPTRVKIVVMNEDDTTDIYVERASLAIACSNIS